MRENKKKEEEMVSLVKPDEEKTKPVIKLSYPYRVEKKDTKEKDFDKFVKVFKKLETHMPFFEDGPVLGVVTSFKLRVFTINFYHREGNITDNPNLVRYSKLFDSFLDEGKVLGTPHLPCSQGY